ncbi:MAG: prefoldin subunit beta [archaeon]
MAKNTTTQGIDFEKEEAQAQAQGLVMQMQAYQQQQQALAAQKQQIEVSLAEVESAIETLKKTSEEMVYRAIGPIMVRKKKEDVEKDLAELVETAKIRLVTVKRQEEKVREKIREITEKITPLLKKAGFEE